MDVSEYKRYTFIYKQRRQVVENTPSEWLSMHNSQFDNESSLNWTMKMAINYEWGGRVTVNKYDLYEKAQLW